MIANELEALNWLTRKLERLGRVGDEERLRLASLPVRLERIGRGRHIVREGEVPMECCLLVEGYACRYKMTPNGCRQIVSFHLRGDILDIQHLLLVRADHSVEAITAATIGWIPKADLLQLAWERPAIGKALWQDCLIDSSIFREWVLNVGRRDARSRVAHMLCEFVARCQAAGLGTVDTFELPMTQEQIADATGLTTVHVNRMLRILDQDGAIVRNGKHLRIRNWGRLCTIADFDPAYLHEAA